MTGKLQIMIPLDKLLDAIDEVYGASTAGTNTDSPTHMIIKNVLAIVLCRIGDMIPVEDRKELKGRKVSAFIQTKGGK